MKKTLFSLSAIAVLGLSASVASAACDFDAPFKAKGLKTDMVRAMTQCGGTDGIAPNDQTSTGIPGCSPPVPLSSYSFGPKGKCSVKTSQKAEAPCKINGDPSCADINIKVSCSDILDTDGTTPANGPGWSITTLSRAVLEDSNAGGDGDQLTIVNFPLQMPLEDASKGKIKAKLSANGLLGTSGPLPACTAVQILDLFIIDPAGDSFAAMGSQSR
jgi:hypothetical protein